MAARQEKKIFNSDDYQFSCSLCGEKTNHENLLFACISSHTHPGDKSSPEKHVYQLDDFCDCNSCCCCFRQAETGYVIEEMIGYVHVICKKCSLVNRRREWGLHERKLYQHCFFCSQAYQFNCPYCSVTHLMGSHTLISQYEHIIHTCKCGRKITTKELALSNLM